MLISQHWFLFDASPPSRHFWARLIDLALVLTEERFEGLETITAWEALTLHQFWGSLMHGKRIDTQMGQSHP